MSLGIAVLIVPLIAEVELPVQRHPSAVCCDDDRADSS
jgi:hypothetical protein